MNPYFLKKMEKWDCMIEPIISANCFCSDGLYPYNVPNEIGRELPMGMFWFIRNNAVNFLEIKKEYFS